MLDGFTKLFHGTPQRKCLSKNYRFADPKFLERFDGISNFPFLRVKMHTKKIKLKYNSAIADAIAYLDKPKEIGSVFAGFQKYLYQVVT